MDAGIKTPASLIVIRKMKKFKKYLRTAGLMLFILLSGFGMGIDPNIFKPKRIENEKEIKTEQVVTKEEDGETTLHDVK